MSKKAEKLVKKNYQETLKLVREKFRIAMSATQLKDFVDASGNIITSRLELWALAFLIDESVALKRLTKVLIFFSIVLSILTFVLAYPLLFPK